MIIGNSNWKKKIIRLVVYILHLECHKQDHGGVLEDWQRIVQPPHAKVQQVSWLIYTCEWYYFTSFQTNKNKSSHLQKVSCLLQLCLFISNTVVLLCLKIIKWFVCWDVQAPVGRSRTAYPLLLLRVSLEKCEQTKVDMQNEARPEQQKQVGNGEESSATMDLICTTRVSAALEVS